MAFETAFAVLGLVADGNPVCPRCGTGKKGKVAFKRNKGYWTCYKCSSWGTLLGNKARGEQGLLEEIGGYSFVDSVNLLLGRPLTGPRKAPKVVPKLVVDSHDHEAVVDVEVYDAVLAAGSVEAAQRFFARWHIDPDVVAESGAVVLEKPRETYLELLDRFGRERLIACGLVIPGHDGSDGRRTKPDWPLLGARYPVVEPHRRPDGHTVGMQFRASHAQAAKAASYDARKAKYDQTKAAHEAIHGEGTYDPDGKRKPRFESKFLSLKGGAPGEHLIGCGLPRISSLEPGQRIYVVEGFKDMLAARTLGVEAYAIPGVGVMPPPRVCRILARHTAIKCMDADEGGERGSEWLDEVFTANDVPFAPKDPPLRPGFDVTDELVDRRARRGCDCRTCVEWRERHPDAAQAAEEAGRAAA